MGWLQDTRASLQAEFPTKTVTLNYSPYLYSLDDLKAITPYTDLVFDEGNFTEFGSANLSDSAWQQEVDALEYLNGHGKAFDIGANVDASGDQTVTHAQVTWVLANYLLVKGASSYVYVYAGNGQGFVGSPSGYGTFYDRPEYHVQIGSPTSARYQSQGVQMRNYSGGLAIVNPSSSQTYTVSLGQQYTDMYGQTQATVTLSPTSGVVLLSGSAASTASRLREAQFRTRSLAAGCLAAHGDRHVPSVSRPARPTTPAPHGHDVARARSAHTRWASLSSCTAALATPRRATIQDHRRGRRPAAPRGLFSGSAWRPWALRLPIK